MKPRPHLSSTRDRQRGSVLIVAALFAAIIAVALGSYMALSSTSLKLANRSFYSNAALNLAETGIEEAMWSFNQVHGGAALGTAWANWTITPTSGADGIATRTFSNFPLAGNTTGAVKVYVDHYNPSGLTQPKVLARATISIPESSPIVKELEVTLSKRSYFAMGMVAEDTITFAGNNAVVDSWNSQFHDDGTPRGSPVAYSAPFPVGDHRNYDRPRVGGANANGNGSIGAKAVGVGITVQNADIYGTASTSGSNPAASINTGPNGTVQAPPPAPRPPNGEDPARISGGFNPQLEMPTAPTVSGSPLTYFGSTLGTAGSTQVFRSTVGITSSLTIHGHVTLVIDVPPGSNAINLAGNSFLKISSGSSLVIFTPGDVKAAGNAGLNNENVQPITFQLYGTSTSSPAQDIKVAGNGAFKGTIYAPKAAIDLKGNGQYQGSIVGYSITVGGGAIFHYDEALADAGGNNAYGLSAWRELVTASERAVYATELSF